jgi:hypothetical protein
MTIPPNNQTARADALRREVMSVPLTPLEWRRHEDLEWAAHSAEVANHPGKLVVIREKRIIGVGDDHQALVNQAVAQEQCPWWEFVVYQVPPLEEFTELST